MDQQTFSRAGAFIDLVVFPLVGGLFVLGGLAMTLVERVTFNSRQIEYSQQPREFVLVVLGTVGVGLAAWAYAGIRYWWLRTHPQTAERDAGHARLRKE